MSSGTLILTSTGLSNEIVAAEIWQILRDKQVSSAVIITTADSNKSAGKYAQLAREQLLAGGLARVDFVDIETETVDFSVYNLIYVCGGNTFRLLKAAQISNFKQAAEELLARDGVYIGVSAGSVILNPTIAVADEIDSDINEVGIADLTGFNLVPFYTIVHYEPKLEPQIQRFITNHPDSEIFRLANDEAAIYQDDVLSLI